MGNLLESCCFPSDNTQDEDGLNALRKAKAWAQYIINIADWDEGKTLTLEELQKTLQDLQDGKRFDQTSFHVKWTKIELQKIVEEFDQIDKDGNHELSQDELVKHLLAAYRKAQDLIEAAGGGDKAFPGLADANSKELWSLDKMEAAPNEVPTSDQAAPTDNAENPQEPSVSATGDA